MKIGYPCINRSVGCTANRTFRLRNYSEERLVEIVENNVHCLQKILEYNVEHSMLFFRISSDIIPFASHPVCTFDWQSRFKKEFAALGSFIKKHEIRISMHPDQFVIINAKDAGIVERSINELRYHAAVLDSLGLDRSAKIQIHIGGVYGNKEKSIYRFVQQYSQLEKSIKDRMVIENDDRQYSIRDCLEISSRTRVPVLLDVFHHAVFNNSEPIEEVLLYAEKTWSRGDGIPMIDYSSQQKDERRGKHVESIDIKDFKRFLALSSPVNFDCMLEIKNKERSAQKAIAAASKDSRFVSSPPPQQHR
ncbi:MAG: UV DNA damage repair endonuclease UvsE [Chitinivibrionales bacterium]|nr:UV DNA damage repair endonuclease UvsE [Chitinivibrionales bacterium]